MITLNNVSLDFPLVSKSPKKKSAPRGMQTTGGVTHTTANGKSALRALENITFTLQPGDRLALLGHNGAGKTTLLRTMAGIYHPTEGYVHSEGRISALLNLSFGIDLETNGFDNIVTRGLYLGMSRAEIKSKRNAIAEFSELGDFLNQPVRTYSAGMRARLAFAVSAHIDPDILLLDEVVATGDRSFVTQARQKLENVSDQAKILVLASHSNSVLRELCNKGMLLEHGKIKAFGNLDEVIDAYRFDVDNQHFLKQDELKVNATGAAASQVSSTRVLLINDTGSLPNPGCRAVRKGYKLIFDNHIKDTKIASSIPVSYGIDHFRSIALHGRDSIKTVEGKFSRPAIDILNLDISHWEKLRQDFAIKYPNFLEAGKNSDLIVINGEGSIHHNSVRGLTLLAMAKTLAEENKKILLLNATIQEMCIPLLKDVLPLMHLIHVREQASKNLLDSLSIDSILAPDLAYLALEAESPPRTKLLDATSYILITAGVTQTRATIEQLFQTVQSTGLRPVYLSIGDGGETPLATELCSTYGVPLIDAATIGVKEMIGFLKQFPLAISGRHHINIFLMRAGVPFLALPSNTWKIEGNLKLVNYPIAPVSSFQALKSGLANLIENKEEMAIASGNSYCTGNAQFKDLLDRLKQ